MKIFIEEYGRLMISILIGMGVIVLLVSGLSMWYKKAYTRGNQQYDSIDVYEVNEPVMLVDNIQIERQEENKKLDYTKYVHAYNDSSKEIELTPQVWGSDSVDITKQGMYKLIFMATNTSGHSFMKEVPVLVY